MILSPCGGVGDETNPLTEVDEATIYTVLVRMCYMLCSTRISSSILIVS